MTSQRTVILQELGKTTSHPTAGELYDAVRKRLPRISLGTVYRNLELLASHGMIQKLQLCGAPARFDARQDGHYHVRCIRCDRVEDIPLPPLPEVERLVSRAVDYRLIAVRLECTGVCRRCRESRANPAAGGREEKGDR